MDALVRNQICATSDGPYIGHIEARKGLDLDDISNGVRLHRVRGAFEFYWRF